MPKLVSELAQGNQFGRSSDGGNLADTAVRVWKVILSSANEPLDIFAAIGVQIGDPYSSWNQVPCVSIEGRADGESRLVRIITATYKTTPGDNSSGEDPKLVMPELRPANFSTSTSLYEMPADKWIAYPDGNTWDPVVNALGDPMDGVTKMEAITTIRVTQFGPTPGTIFSEHCGKINSETMNLGSYMTCQPHTVMFRGVEATPHVETFGIVTYRGFMNAYEFAYRSHFVDGLGQCGWDATPLHTGFNVKAFTPNLVQTTNDNFAVPLKHDDDYGPITVPLALVDGVSAGQKVRAHVLVTGNGKNAQQQPSAQPVALNEDGTPRNTDTQTPKVIVWRRQVQTAINLTSTLQLRLG